PAPIETFATADGWHVGSGADETAQRGNWGWGTAERTTYYEYQLIQPAGGRGGPADAAWWTGPTRFDWQSHGVGGGQAPPHSAAFDPTDLDEPRLRYYVWYLAWDMTDFPRNRLTTDDDLVVEASCDDGTTWTEIDRVNGIPRQWELRDVPLAGKIGSAKHITL